MGGTSRRRVYAARLSCSICGEVHRAFTRRAFSQCGASVLIFFPDVNFLLQMGPSWKDIYIPNQKLDALARSTGDSDKAIRTLIASQNDPIVRHRLTVFSERLDELAAIHGTPDSIVLEFVREDFMGKKAKMEYVKFQRERASERAKARDEAAKAGATEGAADKTSFSCARTGRKLYRACFRGEDKTSRLGSFGAKCRGRSGRFPPTRLGGKAWGEN